MTKSAVQGLNFNPQSLITPWMVWMKTYLVASKLDCWGFDVARATHALMKQLAFFKVLHRCGALQRLLHDLLRFRRFFEASQGWWPSWMNHLIPVLEFSAGLLKSPLPGEMIDSGLKGRALSEAVFVWHVARLEEKIKSD
jgi:hypothetical protein